MEHTPLHTKRYLSVTPNGLPLGVTTLKQEQRQAIENTNTDTLIIRAGNKKDVDSQTTSILKQK